MSRCRNFGLYIPRLFLLWTILTILTFGGDEKAMLAQASQMVKVYDAVGHAARMALFEKDERGWHRIGASWQVRIGRNGLGKEREGDGKTPTGIFALGDVYSVDKVVTKMPFFLSEEGHLVCVDDPVSRYYNRIVDKTRVIEDFKSFEKMRREDGLYDLLITVGYNASNELGKGSCIFLHIANGDKPTAGCITMERQALRKVIAWLDPRKHPVILIERWKPAARFASATRLR